MSAGKTIPIAILQFDEACYPRVQRDDDRVAQLADLLLAGQPLPPVIVEKSTGIVLGGWHTVAAYERRGAAAVPVEFVAVPEADRLLFAYRHDAAAALPYRDVDVQKVARLEYERRKANGGGTVEQIAKVLGRSPQTVGRWLAAQVERDARDAEQQRRARMIAVHALVAVGVPQRRIAEYLGVGETQVRRDYHVVVTAHMQDPSLVSAAETILDRAIGRAPREIIAAALVWLVEQTRPEVAARARRRRALAQWQSDVARAADVLTGVLGDSSGDLPDPARAALVAGLAHLQDAGARLREAYERGDQ